MYRDRKREQNNGLSIAVKKILKRFLFLSLGLWCSFFVFSISVSQEKLKQGKNHDKGDVIEILNFWARQRINDTYLIWWLLLSIDINMAHFLS